MTYQERTYGQQIPPVIYRTSSPFETGAQKEGQERKYSDDLKEADQSLTMVMYNQQEWRLDTGWTKDAVDQQLSYKCSPRIDKKQTRGKTSERQTDGRRKASSIEWKDMKHDMT